MQDVPVGNPGLCFWLAWLAFIWLLVPVVMQTRRRGGVLTLMSESTSSGGMDVAAFVGINVHGNESCDSSATN